MVCYLSSHQLGFQYPGQISPLFQDLNFQIDTQSRIGLIGRNGIGKSTLIRLLSGDLSPSWGRLERSPELRIGYLPQSPGSELLRQQPSASVADFLWQAQPRLQHLRQQIQSGAEFLLDMLTEFEALGGYQFEWQAESELSQVGLSPDDTQRALASLSGGERARAGLAYLNLQQPHFLLLDEPGNDLDAEMLEVLTDFLHDSSLPYLLISHDRRLLDDATESIWELDGQLTLRQGNYQSYRQQRQHERAHQQRVYSQQQKHSQRLQAAAQERRQRAERIESFKPRRSIKNNGGICQKDVGSVRNVRTGNLMRSALAVEQRNQRLQANASRPRPDSQLPALFFRTHLRAGSPVLQVSDLSYHLADRQLFQGLRFDLKLGDRLALTGVNGSGKSSLLKLLLAAYALNSKTEKPELAGQASGSINWGSQVRLGYFAQDLHHLPLEMNPLEWVQAAMPDLDQQPARTRAHTLLACLGLRPPYQQTIASLSRGEQNKVALAALLAAEPDLLVLDEPTNHLELAARERLQAALAEFPGSLLLVCHDRQFRSELCEREIELTL